MCNKSIAAYLQTDYVIDAAEGPIVLRIGEHSSELARMFDTLGVENAAFTTAYNPYGRPTAAADNEAASRCLRGELASVSRAVADGRGQGGFGDWLAEASFLACGVPQEDAMRLSRKYRQNAFVWIEIDCIPELVWVTGQPY